MSDFIAGDFTPSDFSPAEFGVFGGAGLQSPPPGNGAFLPDDFLPSDFLPTEFLPIAPPDPVALLLDATLRFKVGSLRFVGDNGPWLWDCGGDTAKSATVTIYRDGAAMDVSGVKDYESVDGTQVGFLYVLPLPGTYDFYIAVTMSSGAIRTGFAQVSALAR